MSSLISPTDIFDDFYRPFGSLFSQGFPTRLLSDNESWLPATDVREEDNGYIRRERRYGRFTRRFTLPAATNEEEVAAQVKDGVLTVKIPGAEISSPKKIAVE